MILAFFAVIPTLLWDEGPQTAQALEKAGIHEIATTADAGAWAGTHVRATGIDASKLEKLDPPGVDYQLGRGGATAAPWINSSIWRMLKEHGKSFLFEVSAAAVPLAVAEAQAAATPAYFKVKPEDLAAFAAASRFARETEGPALPPRANIGLVDDGSSEMDEIMNLLVRRNLLFQPIRDGAEWKGTVVRVGAGDFKKELAAEPYEFAAVVRSRIGDDKRLVRLYGTETTVARLFGDERHARLHLVQYGRNPVVGMRVRVLGRYPRVLIAALGSRMVVPEDVVVDASATEFTIPELRTYAVVDLDNRDRGVLTSVFSPRDFTLSADPSSAEWKSVTPIRIAANAAGEPLAMGPTEVRSRWTRDSLYLLYTCPYRNLSLKPNPAADRETPVLWNWDVAEAFIGGDFQNIGQYREYQVSPQGEWVDLDIDVLNPKPEGGMGWNSGFEVKARVDEAAKVWYGEMRIPLASINAASIGAGSRLRVGLFRITGPASERTLVAWQPTFRRNFHVPEAFGTVVLEGER